MFGMPIARIIPAPYLRASKFSNMLIIDVKETETIERALKKYKRKFDRQESMKRAASSQVLSPSHLSSAAAELLKAAIQAVQKFGDARVTFITLVLFLIFGYLECKGTEYEECRITPFETTSNTKRDFRPTPSRPIWQMSMQFDAYMNQSILTTFDTSHEVKHSHIRSWMVAASSKQGM